MDSRIRMVTDSKQNMDTMLPRTAIVTNIPPVMMLPELAITVTKARLRAMIRKTATIIASSSDLG